MSNKEDNKEHPPRGNEWEVVSLTSSAYVAASGSYDAYYGAETSRDLFMSDHFVFPPSEHENLPIDEPFFQEEQGKDAEDLTLEGNTRFRDETANNLHNIYGESALASSRHMESLGTESDLYEQELMDAEPDEFAEGSLDLHSDPATNHNLPCEAWWRRRAISIYSRSREANAIWSLFFAAAVTGLVVLGQRWQRERWQILQLKWQSSISSEKLSRVLEPLSRLKDVIVRGNPQATLVRSGSSSEI